MNRNEAQSDAEMESRVEDKIEQMMGESRVRRSLINENKKKGLDFWQVFGLLVGLVFIAIGGGLGYLWQNLGLYESSMPERVLDPFLEPLVQGGLPRILVHEAAKPAKYEAAQDRDAYIRGFLDRGALTYHRAAAESEGDKDVYLYRVGNVTLGAVTLEKRAIGRFGLWEPVKDEVRMPIYGDLRVIAPQGAALAVNGTAIFAEDKTSTLLPYEELSHLPTDLVDTPYQEAYLITGLYQKPVITAVGIAGNPLDVLWLEDEEGVFVRAMPNAPEEDFPDYEKMALEDKRLYSNYLSNDMGFASLGRRIIQGTEIYRNMQLMETVFYTDHVANTITDEKVHNVRLYSPECLTLNIDYTYTITRANGMTYPFETVLTFSYYMMNGQWLICDIATLQQE